MGHIRSTLSLAAVLATMSLVSPDLGQAASLQLPNLVPLAPHDVRLGNLDDPSAWPPGTKALRFATTTVNRGAYAFELHGDVTERPSPSNERMRPARQCVWWVSRICTQTVPIGNFAWHEQHDHWHLVEFASYELRRVTSEGQPDRSPQGLVGPGQKVSFCLIDIMQVDDDPPGHDPLRSAGLYRSCSPYRQGLSPGWADIYGPALPGQQIPIVPGSIGDGIYALVVTINPGGGLLEADGGDNAAFSLIELSDDLTRVRIVG